MINAMPNLSFINHNSNSGQSLVEVIVALGVFTLVAGGAFLTFWGGQVISIDDVNAQSALDYAQEGLDAVRSIRDRDWSELADGDYGLEFIGSQWQFASTTGDSKEIFTRKVSIMTVDSNTKIATTTISWQTDPLRPLSVVLVEQLTDWQSPLTGGCSSDPISGNWQAPQVIGSADLGAGISGTDVVAKLPYVFMSGTAATASKNDVFAFNVSNPTSPALLRALNIGSGGINALYLKGNYLYAASTNDNKELIIFNISDPANMSEVGSLNLVGSTDAFSVIAFGDATVALGRDEAAANELVFINVENPALPAIISQVAIGDDVNDFTATSERLYLTSEDSVSDIWVYDITNPLNPTLVNNNNLGDNDYISVYLQDKNGLNLLIGSESEDGNEFMSIGATNTAQMYVRDNINLGDDVNDIVCVKGDLVFLSTSNSNKEFIIVNANNPDNLIEYASLNFAQVASGIDYAQNKVFVAVRSNDSLKIITSSP